MGTEPYRSLVKKRKLISVASSMVIIDVLSNF
jgi:hypothetical protein